MNQPASHIAIDYAHFDYGDAVARWFATDAFQLTDTAELVEKTGEQLVAAGIPLYRLSYFRRALHPEYMGTGFFWRRGQTIEVARARHSILQDADFLDNPLPKVYAEKKSIRVRLRDVEPSYPFLKQLKAEGVSDYVVMPVIFGDGHVDALSVASDGPDGFSREHLDRMYALHFLFSRIVETHSLRETAINLLDTYVGHDAGEQILQGRIKRGDGDSIRAVLWYCDLRGFTQLSDRLERQALIDLLNDYFQCMAEAVDAEDGTVLKFIGDAMLAIFPIEAADEAGAVCRRALAAAQKAVTAASALNEARTAAGQVAIEFGLALHVGEVMYGNIGAVDRLDFTVIGPAVNLVTRIESLCRPLGELLLLSDDFAAGLDRPVRGLGPQQFKGVARAREIFVPAD
ncbi:MAG: adenylate/guanylate cyclase domain-containing protein [Alphaproteobacteria bacterium]